MAETIEVLPKEEYARCIDSPSMRCPVVGCQALLIVESADPPPFGSMALVKGKNLALRRDDERVPRFHIGCDGEPMHVWSKADLLFLRGAPVFVGDRVGPWNGA